MFLSKSDAQFLLSVAWRGIEAERQFNEGEVKGNYARTLGPDWAVSKTREFEDNRSRYYEIRNKLFPKK